MPESVVVGRTTVREHALSLLEHARRLAGCREAWIETEEQRGSNSGD